MQELMCFSAFLYQYIESIMFLEVARRGGAIAPLAPPLNPPLYMYVNVTYVANLQKQVLSVHATTHIQ